MPKSLIVCCDGTWNQPETESQQCYPTNVLRLVRALKPRTSNGDQVAYYDMGVGTGGWWDRWVGGAMGVGLSGNLMEAYRFLVNNWAPGDRLFLFGFSRGAYTVRSLAGLIHTAGLLPKAAMPRFPSVYRYYRTSPEERYKMENVESILEVIDSALQAGRRPRIDLLGVWDTVGALGLPLQGLRKVSRKWVGFHDTQLSTSVLRGVQALAIDEQRKPFAADLWTHAPDANAEQRSHDENRVLQVWFSGIHSDVGGGYSDTRLADITLDFMLGEAEQAGLEFDTSVLELSSPTHRHQGEIHSEYGFPYSLQGKYERPMGNPQRSQDGLHDAINERMHRSAQLRLDEGLPGWNQERHRQAIQQGMPNYTLRAAPRLSVAGDLGVHLALEGHENCQLLDYSRTGARIRCADTVNAGEVLTLYHPRIGQRRSEVRWQNGDQVGLQFAA